MICLVRPPSVESVRFATTTVQLPLGLAYVAAALERAGRTVTVVDAVASAPEVSTKYLTGFLMGARLEQIAEDIPRDAEWIGISIIFTHEWPAVVRLIQLVKARLPDVPIVLGGEHVTSMPEFCLLTSQADYLVLGEGEETVTELCEVIDGKRDPRTVPGIVFREGAEIVVNKRRARRADIDEIPYPAWHLFDVRGYHDNRLTGSVYTDKLTVPILATRGCPYQCTYCSAPNMWTPKWIPRDPVKVVDEIEHWMKTLGAGSFPFQDLTAIIRKDWIVQFCKEVLRRDLKITWQLPVGTRSEAIDAEVARLLKETNMVSMAYAPESGSDDTRRVVKKKVHADALFESVKAAVDAGLNVSFFVIIGLPHETNAHLRDNLPFLERAARAGITDVSVGYYMALPGTELFHSLYDAGKLKLDRGYFTHMLHALAPFPVTSFSDHLSRLDLLTWKFRLFGRFYGTKSGLAGGPKAHLSRIFRGFGEGSHQTKLETAVRNIGTSLVRTAKAQAGARWIPAELEERLFDGWDEAYRSVRTEKCDSGLSPEYPTDTRELQSGNVIVRLKKEHDTARRLPMVRAPSAAAGAH